MERDGGVDPITAIVVTGTPQRPTGSFRVQVGTLTITSATDGQLEGEFDIRARGFLAADPENENSEITVSGTFVAVP